MNISLIVKKTLAWAKKIALFGHINPDGDCLWSMLGLWRLLEKQNKKVKYFTPTKPSKIFNFLPWVEKINVGFDYGSYDLLVFVDFSNYERFVMSEKNSPDFKKHKEYFDKASIVVIDHHLWDEPHHALVIKDVDCMSASELVFEHTIKWRPKMYDAQVATYFYMGLTTDSWNFLYDVNHERILSNALKLVQMGANKSLIINELIRKKSLNSIKFMQLLLSRMEQKGNLIYSYYADKDLKNYSLDQEEASYALNVIQNVDGSSVVLLLRKIDHQLRASLRSKKVQWGKLVDCNAIAKVFGGGGHKPAAWFKLPLQGAFLQQVKNITDKIAKMIK